MKTLHQMRRKHRSWLLLLCAVCLLLSAACRQLECRVEDTPQVKVKDGALWLDVPISLMNHKSEPLDFLTQDWPRPSSKDFFVISDSENLCMVSDIPPTSSCMYYHFSLPPKVKLDYVLRYYVYRAEPGTYRCRLIPGRSHANEVEFEVTIPQGLSIDVPQPDKRAFPRPLSKNLNET